MGETTISGCWLLSDTVLAGVTEPEARENAGEANDDDDDDDDEVVVTLKSVGAAVLG